MHYQDFSKETSSYSLDNGFSLGQASAENTDFVHYWAAYRPNEEYHQDWTQRYTDLQGVPFCYWIMKDEQRIGGCLMLPGILAELFLIPPYEDYDAILTGLIPLLRHWSQDKERLMARYILPEQIPALESQGFRVDEQRHWMICPAKSYSVDFEAEIEVTAPLADEASDYADTFFKAFSGGTGEYGKRTHEQHQSSIQNYFEGTPLADASCVLHDRRTGNIISICLVATYAGHASVNFVVTHPEYQRRGYAKKVIQRALNAIYGSYPWMILAVTVDNPAMGLYHRMGFKPGIAISAMSLEL